MIKPLYSRLSIVHKIRFLLMACGIGFVWTIGLIYVFYGYKSISTNFSQDTINVLTLIGNRNTAAIRFENPQFAEKNLEAMRSDTSIKKICLYDSKGRVFADYIGQNDESDSPACTTATPAWNGLFDEITSQTADTVYLARNIIVDGQLIGAISIERSKSVIKDYILDLILTMALLSFTCIVIAYFVSGLVKKYITQPIIDIAHGAKEIALNNQFSDRFPSKNPDELGRLVDAFNQILSTMENQLKESKTKNSDLIKAQMLSQQHIDQLANNYADCLDSYLVYANMTAKNTLGPRISSYIPYQRDVLDTLVSHHIKLESFQNLSKTYHDALTSDRNRINVAEYLRSFNFRFKQAISYITVEHNIESNTNFNVSVYEIAWNEIFTILIYFLQSIVSFVKFTPILKISINEESSEISFTFVEHKAVSLVKKNESAENSNDNAPLRSFNFNRNLKETIYKANTIEDPNVGDDFIDEEQFTRSEFKYIFDSLSYMANANSITILHSFEPKKFSLNLFLNKCRVKGEINQHEVTIQ